MNRCSLEDLLLIALVVVVLAFTVYAATTLLSLGGRS